jgi:hypothetical protein
MPLSIIEPQAVGRGEVVGNVQVGKPVAVEIAEDHGQAPFAHHGGRFALVVEENPGLVLHRREAPLPVVAVERIGLGQFHHLAVGHHFEAVAKPGIGGGDAIDLTDHPSPVLLAHREAGARIEEVHHIDVVGAVEVEIAIAIHVGQRHRGARGVSVQATVAFLGPAAVAVVEEEPGACGNAVDQQVEIAVAIDIDQHRPGGHLADTGRLAERHGLEAPLSPVAVELVGAVQAAEIEVRAAIAIHITEGHAGSIGGPTALVK